MTANSVKARKAKARVCQDMVSNAVRDAFGLTADDIRSTPMGLQGEDVLFLSGRARAVFPFAVECQNADATLFWAKWRQAERHSEKLKLPPLFVFKNPRMARGQAFVMLEWKTFLEILKSREEVSIKMRALEDRLNG